MSEEVLIGIDVKGVEQISDLSKKSAAAKAELATLQKQVLSLQKELNKLTVGTTEYNAVLEQIAKTQVQVTNAKIQNINATRELNTTVKQLTTSTYGLSEAEIQMQSSFNTLITSLYTFQNSATKSEELTMKMVNAFQVYTGKAVEVANANTKLGASSSKIIDTKTNNLLINFNQILRETPNFAISTRIGIMSLANNIPMLVDAWQSASKAGMSFMQILGQLKTAILSVQGAFIALTVIATLLTNSAVLEWFGKLFSSTKKVADNIQVLTASYEDFFKSFEKNSSKIAEATENFAKVEVVLKAVESGFVDAKTALELFNDTFGDTLGEAKTVSEALAKLSNKNVAYIDALSGTAKSNSYLEMLKDMAKTEKELILIQEELEKVNKKTISDPYFIQEEDMSTFIKVLYKEDTDTYKEYFKKRDEFVKDKAKADKKLKELENYTPQPNEMGIISPASSALVKQDIKDTKRLQQDLKLNWEKYQSGLYNQMNTATQKELDLIHLRREEVTEEYKTNYNKTLEDAKNNGINLFKTTKETVDKIDAYTRKDKIVPKSVDITEYQKQLDSILNITVQFTDEQKVLIAKAQEYTGSVINSYKTFYGLNRMELINFDLDLQNARLKDLENQKNVNKDKLADLNLAIQIQRDLYNLDLVDTQKSLRDKEVALNEDYKKQAELENKIAQLKKSFDKANEEKRFGDAQALKDQIATTDALLQDTERRIAGGEKSVSKYKDELKALQERRKEIEKNVDSAKDTAQQLAEIDQKIADTTIAIVQTQKDKIQEMLDQFGQFADAFGDLFSAIADSYQTNMDITNQNYDLEQKRIEESNLSEKEKSRQLKQLEVERYEALKKDFERQKKVKEAVAWVDLASGLVSIAAHSMDLGPIAGPILASIQAAALILTTKNNIKKIRAEKLDSPSGGGSDSIVKASATPVTPNETTLTSPQQNLNQQNSDKQAYVKVSEINQVQQKVSVREANQTY